MSKKYSIRSKQSTPLAKMVMFTNFIVLQKHLLPLFHSHQKLLQLSQGYIISTTIILPTMHISSSPPKNILPDKYCTSMSLYAFGEPLSVVVGSNIICNNMTR